MEKKDHNRDPQFGKQNKKSSQVNNKLEIRNAGWLAAADSLAYDITNKKCDPNIERKFEEIGTPVWPAEIRN